MKHRICLLLPAFCSIFAIGGLMSYVSPMAASANCVVLNNHSGYMASDGKYYVTGEVQNQGTTSALNPWISVRFLDAHGIQVTSYITPSFLSLLLPGRKAPFKTWVESTNVHSYEVYNLTFSETSDLPLGLEITSHSWTKTSGNITVTGSVKNAGTYSAHALHVVCTFYDSDKKVVGAQNAIIADTPLNPQQQRPFTITERTDPGRESVYATYELTAESNEYETIPELPFSACICALLATSMSLILLRKAKLERGSAIGNRQRYLSRTMIPKRVPSDRKRSPFDRS